MNDLTIKKCLHENGAAGDKCSCQQASVPCHIIIFGASGDLTQKKLLPSLFNLFANGFFPENLSVTGCARSQIDSSEFRRKSKISIEQNCSCELSGIEAFLDCLYYKPIEYDDLNTFKGLSGFIRDIEKKRSTNGNFVFYLALPPFLYISVINMIARSELSSKQYGTGWKRIIVEKPFGTDYNSAVKINEVLRKYFQEDQIYRIDHYLAKETVQNILVFRFANTIFEPIWNRQHIEYIAICASEKIGIEHRAGYYEKAGVIRDMFQNHIMQMLALTAMEPPARFAAEMVRDEKAKLFRCLRQFDNDKLEENVVLGQYSGGTVDGKEVFSYRNEKGVDSQSLTPTFALLKVFIDNWRWQGVPFFLLSGKRLAEKTTRIVVQFKDVPYSIFRDVLTSSINPNRLVFHIQPDEIISLGFQAKRPGSSICLRTINMQFSYNPEAEKGIGAYEKVLLDCINGEQMLYIRQDSEELCWGFLTPIIEEWEQFQSSKKLLHFYPAGTWGPDETNSVFKPANLFL